MEITEETNGTWTQNKSSTGVTRTSLRLPADLLKDLTSKANDRGMSVSLYSRCIISNYAHRLQTESELVSALANTSGDRLCRRLEDLKSVQIPVHTGWEILQTFHSANTAQFSFRCGTNDLHILSVYAKARGIKKSAVIRSALLEVLA